MKNQESIQTIKEIFSEVRKLDDTLLKTTQDLKLVLLNLKIESAHIKEVNGIMPIADRLEITIEKMHNELNEFIHNNRDRLTNTIKELETNNESEVG